MPRSLSGEHRGCFPLHTARVAPTDPQRHLPPRTWQRRGGVGGGIETSPLCPSHSRQHPSRPSRPTCRKPSSGPKDYPHVGDKETGPEQLSDCPKTQTECSWWHAQTRSQKRNQLQVASTVFCGVWGLLGNWDPLAPH